ncbi:MAG: chemotaxis protein CheA [Proteobacteria bacterium]|nr:chemotaxis protein CheA [Pseudomonadota bacterium]MBU1737726.1 chemotaxis protein CheA [Pseudomonadota bacterium]
MAGKKRGVSELLEEMALKIMMVEPGTLGEVGELLGFIEEFMSLDQSASPPELFRMADLLQKALEKIIMAELDDSAGNYERIGQCIVYMQEINRKGTSEAADVEKFCNDLKATGFAVSPQIFSGDSSAQAVEEPAGKEQSTEEDVNLDFLQDKELLTGFIEEAFDHLESIEVNVLDLEQNPDDLEIINNIFRPFHTIKGVSGFLNLKTINKLAHTTENLLDDVRNGVREMDSEVIDVVLSVGDALKSMVENIKDVLEKGVDSYKQFDISGFVKRISVLREGGSLPAEAGKAAERTVPAKESDDPVPADTETGKGEEPSGSDPDSDKKSDDGQSRKGKVGASIKVDIEKLDGLVNAVGELVIMQAMVQQNPLVSSIADPKLTKDFSQLSRITSELQKTAMAMRMVPIRQTFQKMTRLVRDLSKKSGKLVDLVMIGEETEIDRNMVDSIYDPLVHMIRNSVDHGVQTPEERKKIGKSATGMVKLSAYQKGGYIVIEIEDDGNGLNSEKIRKKAIDRGIIKEGENLNDHELNNLIFLPGFSTADKITDVSGRGVGMDVVKKAVDKLRGKVEVISQPGEGSQFVIRLPLTLAIIDGIIVRVGEERYIIPTIAIQESMKPEPEKYNTVQGKGETLMVRNKLVPIIRLCEVFNIDGANEDPWNSIVVVIENEGRQRALMVDELLGKQEVVIKSLGGYLKDIPGVAGGTILGDGRVGLILDLAGLISTGDGKQKLESADDEGE